jgi:predicted outer membrane protein
MFHTRLAAVFTPLFIITGAGAVLASTPPSGQHPSAKDTPELNKTFSALHGVVQWSTDLSDMADQRAKSDLVKRYAREVKSANTTSEAKLMRTAKDAGIEVTPLDPQSEEGKSMLDRMKAETALLGSLQGDAFDKEYMMLVTNTQQSVIHVLDASKASAHDEGVKQFLGETSTAVQGRLRTAQNVMANVYGDKI